MAEEDDQGSPVLGKGSSSTASLQRQISQEIRRVGRLASPRSRCTIQAPASAVSRKLDLLPKFKRCALAVHVVGERERSSRVASAHLGLPRDGACRSIVEAPVLGKFNKTQPLASCTVSFCWMIMVERRKLLGLPAHLVFLLMFSASLAESNTICTNKLRSAPVLREI